MVKKPIPFLLHIQDAIELITSYITGYTFKQFQVDRKTQDAVIRQLDIIGEATAQLESDFVTNNPEIPWREISDFRNVLAHEYWNIDLEIVWKAATEEIQVLKRALLPIIEKLNTKAQSF